MTRSVSQVFRHPDGGAATKKGAAYGNLKKRILNGALKPGAPLPERDIANVYLISRTPVREILQRLHHEGLVELVANRGAFVRRLSGEELIDIFYAREAVEGMAARLAAVRRDAERLSALEDLFARLPVEDRSESLARMIEAGRRLHDFLVEASGNALLQRAYGVLRSHAMLIRSMTRRAFRLERASYRDHVRILGAVRQQHPVAAEQAMRRHLTSTRERLIREMFGTMPSRAGRERE